MKGATLVMVLAALACVCLGGRVRNDTMASSLFDANVNSIGRNKVMPLKEVEHEYCVFSGNCPQLGHKRVTGGAMPCVNGFVTAEGPNGAENYECDRIDLQSFVPVEELVAEGYEGFDLNDIWGAEVAYVDSNGANKIMYLALVGMMNGVSVVDVTDSINPVVKGFLPTRHLRSIWRDIKVFKDYAFIVSETPKHGMQVLDLQAITRLPPGPAVVLPEAAHYGGFGNTHNLVINEETGYAYAVGTSHCAGGLYMVDINEPLNPTYAGCFDADGYTHDAQCVVYRGPDASFQGREICFAYNEDTVTIVDVTDKANPVQISRTPYHGAEYTHQGWLTEDQRYTLVDDELDEMYGSTFDDKGENHGAFTRTLVWDLADLRNPVWAHTFVHSHTSIDHNLYVHNGVAYCSNYCSGLRVINVQDIANIHEVASFDIAPYCDGPLFQGTWSNFPYFNHPQDSANTQIVIVTSIERGLFVVKVHL
jgi:choice-of-anchor B domain-containing protein